MRSDARPLLHGEGNRTVQRSPKQVRHKQEVQRSGDEGRRVGKTKQRAQKVLLERQRIREHRGWSRRLGSQPAKAQQQNGYKTLGTTRIQTPKPKKEAAGNPSPDDLFK